MDLKALATECDIGYLMDPQDSCFVGKQMRALAAKLLLAQREAIAAACLMHINEPQVMVESRLDDEERAVVCRECAAISLQTTFCADEGT